MDHLRLELVDRNHLLDLVAGSRHHHRSRMRRAVGNLLVAGNLHLEEAHPGIHLVDGFLQVSMYSVQNKE